MKVCFAFLVAFWQTVSVAGQNQTNTTTCSICPSGSTLGDPNRTIFVSNKNPTCGEVEAEVSQITDSTLCASTLSPFQLLDLAAFCGCSGSTLPNVCTLCSQNQSLINGNQTVNTGQGFSVTCDEAALFATYVSDNTVCRGLTVVVGSQCCSSGPKSPTAPTPTAPTAASPSAAPAGNCSLCSDGSTILFPGRQLFGGYGTCGELESRLADLSLKNCSQLLDQTGALVDIGAYCGCPGTTSPGVCTLCGSGGSIAYPNKTVTSTQFNVTTTCEGVNTFAKYISKQQICTGLEGVFATECCQSASTPTTPAPMSAPSAPVSSPMAAAPSGPTAKTSSAKTWNAAGLVDFSRLVLLVVGTVLLW